MHAVCVFCVCVIAGVSILFIMRGRHMQQSDSGGDTAAASGTATPLDTSTSALTSPLLSARAELVVPSPLPGTPHSADGGVASDVVSYTSMPSHASFVEATADIT
jgi:hypothetical protein